MKIVFTQNQLTKQRMMKLLVWILIFVCVSSNTTEAAPRLRRAPRHDDDSNSDEELETGEEVISGQKSDSFNIAELTKHMSPVFTSNLVRFSTEKPSEPPWPVAASVSDADQFENDDVVSETDSFGRRKRRELNLEPEIDVCEGQSGWKMNSWAYNNRGVNVTVPKTLRWGNVTIHQYFYETWCKGETAHTCTGINTHRYTSQCKEKYSWVGALVHDSLGYRQDFIKIKTSCVCAIRRIRDPLLRTTRDAFLFALLNKNWRDQ